MKEGGQAGRILLMSFNLRRDKAEDGPDAWPRRREAVARLLRRHAPVLFGVQEALPHMLRDLDLALPHYRRTGVGRLEDGGGEHVAIYHDARRLRLVRSGDVWLSETPGVPGSASWGNGYPRHVTWGRYVDRASGAAFSVANAHLDHASAESRVKGARLLRRLFPHAVVMGDLNEDPEGPVRRILSETHFDALDAFDAPGTQHGFAGEASFCDRFDAVLLPHGWTARRADVLVDRLPDGRYPSDHFPVDVGAARHDLRL